MSTNLIDQKILKEITDELVQATKYIFIEDDENLFPIPLRAHFRNWLTETFEPKLNLVDIPFYKKEPFDEKSWTETLTPEELSILGFECCSIFEKLLNMLDTYDMIITEKFEKIPISTLQKVREDYIMNVEKCTPELSLDDLLSLIDLSVCVEDQPLIVLYLNLLLFTIEFRKFNRMCFHAK